VIACALCLGTAPEPYLEATLASIAQAVDLLVVNDNAGGEPNPNLAVVERSRFARDGRLRVVRTRFVDFATMRNDAFGALAASAEPDWVLWLDADEVHGAEIAALTRGLLPRLGDGYGSVDGYTYHFIGSFAWISDVARRFCAYRFDPSLRWRNPVHEKIEGLRGKALVLPYRYAHYGNVLPPALAVRKHLRYLALGSAVAYTPPAPDAATLEDVFAGRGRHARRFEGTHPPAARPLIAQLEREWSDQFAAIERLFVREQRPADRLANALRGALEETRIRLRYLQHPGLSRLPDPGARPEPGAETQPAP
jgi:hypothetical protein